MEGDTDGDIDALMLGDIDGLILGLIETEGDSDGDTDTDGEMLGEIDVLGDTAIPAAKLSKVMQLSGSKLLLSTTIPTFPPEKVVSFPIYIAFQVGSLLTWKKAHMLPTISCLNPAFS